MMGDIQQSELHSAFQNSSIHQRWTAVYRRNPLQQSFNEALLDRLLRLLDLSTDSCILDAGCGTGDHAIRLAKRGYRCVGVDVSEAVIREAFEQAEEAGVSARATFFQDALEHLSFPDGHFDAVHCRGVLMHIPRWDDAVNQLCRVLKPGGTLVVVENNQQSLETLIVRLVRLLRRSGSKMVKTRAGIEFHGGAAPLSRVADINWLKDYLSKQGMHIVRRMGTEFWDINRFPSGFLRNLAICLNRASFSVRLPARFSSGNAVIAVKTSLEPI